MAKKESNPPPPRPPANGQRGINEGLNVNPHPPNVRPAPPPPPPPPPPAKKDG